MDVDVTTKCVGPPNRRAEMYAGRVTCCRLVSHGEYADETDRHTDRRTDARPSHYAFRYGRGQRKNSAYSEIPAGCQRQRRESAALYRQKVEKVDS